MNSRQKRVRNHRNRISNNKTVCPECGERGKHYVGPNWFRVGFWTCDKFYDKETDRRMDIENLAIQPRPYADLRESFIKAHVG